jgi:hypothetical protein
MPDVKIKVRGIYSYIIVFVVCACNTYAQQPFHDEASFRRYIQSRQDSLDIIEGIWNINTTQQFFRYDTMYDEIKYHKAAKVAVVKRGEKYESVDLSGEANNVEFTKTEVSGVYYYRNYFKETGSYSKADALISKKGEMSFSYEFPTEYLKFKLGDSYETGTRVINKCIWTKIFPEKKADKK